MSFLYSKFYKESKYVWTEAKLDSLQKLWPLKVRPGSKKKNIFYSKNCFKDFPKNLTKYVCTFTTLNIKVHENEKNKINTVWSELRAGDGCLIRLLYNEWSRVDNELRIEQTATAAIASAARVLCHLYLMMVVEQRRSRRLRLKLRYKHLSRADRRGRVLAVMRIANYTAIRLTHHRRVERLIVVVVVIVQSAVVAQGRRAGRLLLLLH